jgi:ankyrin repeat protein
VHSGHLGVSTQQVTAPADLSLDGFYPAFKPQNIDMPSTRPTMSTWAAAKLSDWDELEALVDQGADVNAADERNRTALFWAAVNGSAEDIFFLTAHGADVHARDISGRTPLHYAVDIEIAKALCASGADVNARSRTGETPLLAAQRHNRRDVADYLRANGALVSPATRPVNPS